jgi:RNA polymerase sigma-70 factor, ECF subfamily
VDALAGEETAPLGDGRVPADEAQCRRGAEIRQICEKCCDSTRISVSECSNAGPTRLRTAPPTGRIAADMGANPGEVSRSPQAQPPPAAEDEGALLEALRRGDEDAFKALVEAHGPVLMRLALSHVPSRAVAEEVVQETWIGVLNGLDRFEGRSSLRTWIISILLNNARTRGKRERRTLPFSFLRRDHPEGRDEPAVPPKRFQPRGEEAGAWARAPVEWASPEERLATDAARRVMLEAIADLPERQREVIALRDVSGWSAAETCNALGLSETNQRVLLHRARSKVRIALEEHFEAEGSSG